MLVAGLASLVGSGMDAQTTVNAAQHVSLQGLRTNAGQGSFNAASYASDGSLYLLLDQGDGVRILKADAQGSNVSAQSQLGVAGDSGVAMSVDPAGNIYITGTTTSGALTGSSGVAFPKAADGSTNSFLAKYDANLHLIFLTFLGSGRTAASSVAATADAVFVTGITFNNAFPVTSAGIQQTPANGSTENGFVERFSTDGTTLNYATYLTGSGGNTIPTAIVADSADSAYIAGSTSASGFPTVNALQSEVLLAKGATNSGFLAKLNPAGSAFTFSTFIAGAGITGLSLDAATNSLVLTGDVALGQFPVATVAMPLTSTTYQTLLRIPEDGQSVTSSVLLAAGTQSFASVGANGDAWISGTVGVPLFPGFVQPDYSAGDSFLLHVTANNVIDQTMRFGGLPKNNQAYASLTSKVAAPAVFGSTVALPGAITATLSPSLLGTETFDLPLVQAPTNLLPNTLRDILPSASACSTSSVCSGTGAMLAFVSTTSSASLGIANDGLPNITVRNLGSAEATGFLLTTSGYTSSSNCGSSLLPSSQCSVALAGSGPGTLTVSAANTATATVALSATPVVADAITLSTNELDFGIVTAGATINRNITVTNLSGSSQTFSSAKDAGANSASYSVAEAVTDCPSGGASGVHQLSAGASCRITLGLGAAASSTSDGPVRVVWKIGQRDVVLTGFTQAAALNVSATEVDFGTQIAGGVTLPRYLYLSNNSLASIEHAAVTLRSGSPFSVIDGCPSTLPSQSFCRLQIDYQPMQPTSSDSTLLTLDEGITVLVTGTSLPPASVKGTAANPKLSVSATSLNFPTAVNVTGVSSASQSVTISNTGSTSFSLAVNSNGDFNITNGCPSTLNGGASCTLLVGFAPSQPGAREGLISISTGSGFAPAYVGLSGTGTAILPANNGLLSLGTTLAGEPLVQWYKVQQSLPALTAAVIGAGFGVALVQDSGGGHGTLPPDSFAATATSACASCWLGVQYLSQVAQTQSATLSLTTVAGGNPYTIAAAATALPVQGLVLTPTLQDFGAVAVGSSSAAQTLTLANLLNPSAVVNIQSVATTGDFAIAANNTGGSSCSGAVPATASCFVQVVFSPTATGERDGALTIITSAGSASVSLSGYGLSSQGLAIHPSALTFTAVPGPSSTVQTITFTNSGTATLSIGTMTSSDVSFLVNSGCGTLAPGATCDATVTFTPQNAMVASTLSVPVSETVNGQVVNSMYSVALSGAYTSADAGLQILPNAVNYGAVGTGSVGATREYTLNNLSGKALNVTLQLPRQFPLAANSPCATLPAGGSCSFSVSFVPVTAGALTGTVFAQGASTDGLTNVQTLAYMLGYGTGSGALTVAGNLVPNAPLSFGQITSGQTAQQRLTLTNTGTGVLTIRRLSSAPPFLSTSTCGATLAVGASCSVTITYAPIDEVATGSSTSGTRNDVGSLSIESDAAASPQFVSLSGLVSPVASSNPASSAVLAAYALSESALTFANTPVGNASAAQTVTLTNTGTTTIHVLSMLPAADFTATTTCGAVLPGASCSFGVAFTPTTGSSAALRTGTLEIQSDATDSLEFISLVGSSSTAPIVLNPTTLSFGTVNVGSSATSSVSVTNTSAAPITFTALSASGAFSVAQGSCPAVGSTLAAGISCTLAVTFTPVGSGMLSGLLSLSTDATQLPLTVSLSGTAAAAQLQVVPGVLGFGSVAVGAASNLTLTLTNTGTATLAGMGGVLSGANAGDFAVTMPCGAASLAAGQGCTETVTFTPSATGARAATLTIGSSDPNGPAVIALSGTGVGAGTFALTVSGGSSATMSVTSGQPATFPLTVTPANGYAGSVALTCTPLNPGKYASCSLLLPLLTLGAGAQDTTVTISTVSAAVSRGTGSFAVWLLLAPLAMLRRRRLPRSWQMLVLLCGCAGFAACGKSGSFPVTGSSGSAVVYTPAGTYQYRVTASSTSGTQISSTVTLNLIVQ
jgi:hypothetical protein